MRRNSCIQPLATMLLLGLPSAACAPLTDDSDVNHDGAIGFKVGASTRYEAEDHSAAQGCSERSNHNGFTGSGFMDFGRQNTWVEWNDVEARLAGEYELTLRYANGGRDDRRAALVVNGDAVANVPFSGSGSWRNWSSETVRVTLQPGNNTVRVQANSGAGGPNLDHMDVVALDLCPDDPRKDEPGECGCGVVDGTCAGDPDEVGPGLVREHYSGTWNRLPDFDQLQPDAVDIAATVDVGPYSNTERFALLFTGNIAIAQAGEYEFELGSDDGSKLLINGELVVDNDGLHGFETRTGSIRLDAGQHALRVEFFERSGGDRVQLRYRRVGGSFVTVPASVLSHGETDADQCPGDPDKTEAGMCGCGVPEGQCDEGTAQNLTLTATADTYVDSANPDANFGSEASLLIDGDPDLYEALVRFQVPTLTAELQRATLRLFVTNDSGAGPQVYRTDANWSENAVTWNSRPAPIGTPLAQVRSAPTGWLEVDVTSAISAGGDHAFTLVQTDTNGVDFDSREGVNAPQLVIVTGEGGGGDADEPTEELEFIRFSGLSAEVTTFLDVSAQYLVYAESHGRNGHNDIRQNQSGFVRVEGATLLGFGGGRDKYLALFRVDSSRVSIDKNGGAAQAVFVRTSSTLSVEEARTVDPAIGGENVPGPRSDEVVIYAEDEGGKSGRDEFYMPRAAHTFGRGDDLLYVFTEDRISGQGPNGNGAFMRVRISP